MTLREWRKSESLTQAEIAKRLGITQGFLCSIENKGTRNLDIALAVREMSGGKVLIETLKKIDEVAA